MPYYRVHIRPVSPIYRGLTSHARKSSAIIHSDTLHSALLCVSTIIDREGYWLTHRAQNLRVSSVYPFFRDIKGKVIYLYPRPFPVYVQDDDKKCTSNTDNDPTQDRKKWKRVKYFSEGFLVEYLKSPENISSLNSSPLEYIDSDTPGKVHKELGETPTCCLRKEVEALVNQPRIISMEDLRTCTINDRGGNYEIKNNKNYKKPSTTPFQRSMIRINTEEGVGLWFLVELSEDELPRFRELLRLLGILGIGGVRTVGYGHFELDEGKDIEPFSSTLITPVNIANHSLLCLKEQHSSGLMPNSFLTLSLYHPTKKEFTPEIFDHHASYECAVRSGWLCGLAGSTMHKKAVRMCLEGSSFPIHINGNPDSNLIPFGDVVDIRDPEENTAHPVWRSGLAIGIAFHNKFIKS